MLKHAGCILSMSPCPCPVDWVVQTVRQQSGKHAHVAPVHFGAGGPPVMLWPSCLWAFVTLCCMWLKTCLQGGCVGSKAGPAVLLNALHK